MRGWVHHVKHKIEGRKEKYWRHGKFSCWPVQTFVAHLIDLDLIGVHHPCLPHDLLALLAACRPSQASSPCVPSRHSWPHVLLPRAWTFLPTWSPHDSAMGAPSSIPCSMSWLHAQEARATWPAPIAGGRVATCVCRSSHHSMWATWSPTSSSCAVRRASTRLAVWG